MLTLTVTNRVVWPPVRVTAVANAEPSMVRFLSRVNWLLNTMVCPASAGAKVMVPLAQRSTIAWRSEPAPLSAVVVTVIAAVQTATLCSVKGMSGAATLALVTRKIINVVRLSAIENRVNIGFASD